MKLFKNIRSKVTNDELAQKIAGNIVARQSRLADYLNKKAKHLSGRTLLLALITFCALFGSYLLYLLIKAMN